MKQHLIKFSLVAVALTLVGCAGSDGKVIPDSTYTMEEVYENKRQQAKVDQTRVREVMRRPATASELSVNPYTLNNTPRSDFRLLPNPTLFMFVAPRLSMQNRSPVPGYMTEFKLYERDEYALPGEINLENIK